MESWDKEGPKWEGAMHYFVTKYMAPKVIYNQFDEDSLTHSYCKLLGI